MKRFLLLLFICSTLIVSSCADFWAPGVRVYKVESYELAPSFTNELSAALNIGEIHLHNHAGTNILVVLSNYVDAGGWTIGSEYIENNLLFTISSNGSSNLSIAQAPGISPDYWNIYSIGSKIHIYLPAGIAIKHLDLFSDTGTIDLNVANSFAGIDLTTETGSVDCRGTLNARVMNMNTQTGSITANILLAEKVLLNTQTSSINVLNKISASNVTAITQTGSIDMKAEHVKDLAVTAQTGSLDIEILNFYNNIANIDLNNTTGSIDLTLSDTTDIKVYATVVTGSIDNRIAFDTETSDRVSLVGQNQAGTRMIDIHTQTGSIDLRRF